MYAALAVLTIFAFLYSAIAGGVERTAVSGPIIFTAVGLLIGPLGFGWLHPDLDAIELLAVTVVCAVTLSILAHGLTANPLARALGPRMGS